MREFGPAFKQLQGDEAMPYIGVARTILGQMKNQMRLGNMPTGRWVRQLEDGTVITVTSQYGIDAIQIMAPVPGPAVQSEPTLTNPDVTFPVDTPSDGYTIFGCGVYSVVGTGGALHNQAFWWSRSTGVVLLQSPLIGTDPSFTAKAISPDGQTVVGYGAVYGGAGSFPFMWTRTGGTSVIGKVGFLAYDIAENGDVLIVGPASEIYRWNKGNLNLVSPGPEASSTPTLSANGQYLAASIGTYPNYVPTVWDRQGRAYTCPLTGLYVARAVSDTGVVVVGTAVPNTLGQFIWDIHKGTVTSFVDPGIVGPEDITRDGLFVCGWGDWQGGVGSETLNSSPATYYDVSKQVSVELPPGPQTYVRSIAYGIDHYDGYILIGGYAALTGKPDNSLPNADMALWELKGGKTALTRIRSPSYPQTGQFTDVTIFRPPAGNGPFGG